MTDEKGSDPLPALPMRPLRPILAASIGLFLIQAPALAYIGPGAGFAAAGSLLVLLGTFALAFGIILIWPIKAVLKVVTLRGKSKAKIKRLVILGLDGFDPGLAKKYMDEGRMPNFKALSEEGCFSPLSTSMPSMEALHPWPQVLKPQSVLSKPVPTREAVHPWL